MEYTYIEERVLPSRPKTSCSHIRAGFLRSCCRFCFECFTIERLKKRLHRHVVAHLRYLLRNDVPRLIVPNGREPTKRASQGMVRRNSVPHTHVSGVSSRCQLYRRARASRKSRLLSQKPCSFSCSTVSHDEDPFSERSSTLGLRLGEFCRRLLCRTASCFRRRFFLGGALSLLPCALRRSKARVHYSAGVSPPPDPLPWLEIPRFPPMQSGQYGVCLVHPAVREVSAR